MNPEASRHVDILLAITEMGIAKQYPALVPVLECSADLIKRQATIIEEFEQRTPKQKAEQCPTR